MADAPTLSPEVSRSVSAIARALVGAARSWTFYPQDHPAAGAALERLRIAIDAACGGTIRDRSGAEVDEPAPVNTWEADGRGDYTWAVVEAVDPDEAGIEPLQYM